MRSKWKGNGNGGKQNWSEELNEGQYLNGAYKKAGECLFTRISSDMTRANSFKLKEGKFLEIRKKV